MASGRASEVCAGVGGAGGRQRVYLLSNKENKDLCGGIEGDPFERVSDWNGTALRMPREGAKLTAASSGAV